MTTVTYEDLLNAARKLDICPTDSLIIHSSMKSLGYVEGGPDTVIDAFLDAVKDGTLLFPTLCQDDWAHIYENWHMDAPSAVGLLTNVFRKRPNALRSNQATHSVAAIGKDAAWFTATHGETEKRPGIFGDTPFSGDSPWAKMYDKNTKILFIGITPRYCTMRHYAEYVFVDESLKQIVHLPEYEEMKSNLWYYGHKPAAWPQINTLAVYAELECKGLVKRAKCGEAELICFDSRPFVDFCLKVMEDVDLLYLRDTGVAYQESIEWLKKMKLLKNE